MAQRRTSGRLAGVVLMFLPALLPSAARAQTGTATIRGAVTDPAGAVVPDAVVRLLDLDRGSETAAITGSNGRYTFVSVRPGYYQIEVEKGGFKSIRVTGVTVNVLDNLEQNFKLDVGPVVDTVRVAAPSGTVNTVDATVSAVVDRQFIDNLPLNGRSIQTLVMMTPGVVVTQTALDDQGQFSVNGQRADANYFTVDGVSANFGVTGYFPLVQAGGGTLPALSASGGTNSLVSVDAIQEFRVQTSSFAPEFGRTPGGQISVVTRSGTNAVRGSAFEYFRDGALDANDWFANAHGLAKPAERQHDFGGVLGGPVLRDRSFFFASYEGLRLRQPATRQSVVPDLTSRQEAPVDLRPFLDAYPLPNGPSVRPGLAQFNGSYSDPSSLHSYGVRLDHAVTDRVHVFGRYNFSPSSFDQRGAPFTTPALSTVESVDSSVHTLTVGVAQLIRRAMSHELRLNYSRQRLATAFSIDGFGGAVPIADSHLFPPGFSSADSAFLLLISGVGEYGQGIAGVDEQRQVNIVDSLSMIAGSHTLKVGVDYRWLAPSSQPFVYRQFVQFTGVTTNAGGTQSGTAAFAQPATFHADELRSHNFSFYGQDTWNASRQWTITYGIRWDIVPALEGKNDANDPFTVVGLDNPAAMTLAPRGTPLYDTTYGNIAPRLGFAYRFRGTVLRGGVGTFYDLGHGSLGGTSAYFPYSASRSLIQVPFPLTPENAAAPPLSLNPPVDMIVVAADHLRLPRTYQWNAAVEQSVLGSQFSLTYVGAAGRDLLRVTNLFNPNSQFGVVSVTSNTSTSDYHSVQAKFERRLSRGLQALASYTWAHSVDTASTDALGTYENTPGSIADPGIDRADSDFDVRQAFTAGVTYVVPAPGSNRGVTALLGGWSLHSFVFARSAPPVNIVGAISFAAGTIVKYRPDVVPGVPLELFGSQYPGGKVFNRAAFTPAPAGEQGNLERNAMRGFGAFQVDIALERRFQLTDDVNLRFRTEFFNILNRPNFGAPVNDLSSALFGQSTQMLAHGLGSGGPNGGFNPLYQVGGPRSIQLALRLEF
jgi:carboxypeptidase family protein